MLLGQAPTPQAVKDKYYFWCGLMVMLLTLFVMKLMTLDILSALISGLMAVLTYLIIRNRMENANGLVMMFAVLCVLNCVFDLVPLVSALNGRTSTASANAVTQVSHGVQRIQVTNLVKTSPFFDSHRNFRYNLRGVELILSPVCMLIGAVLSLKAVYDIQQAIGTELEQEQEERRPFRGANNEGYNAGGNDPEAARQQQSFTAFQGPGHRLVD